MKQVPKPIESIFRNNPDIQKMVIDSIKDNKGSNFIKSTVSLPKSVIAQIEDMNVEYDIPTKRIMQMIKKIFIYMERNCEENHESFGEFLRELRKVHLAETYDPSTLVKKSYLIDKHDATNLKIIAKTGSISRNELISIGVSMFAYAYSQYEDAYMKQVEKYKHKFEHLQREIETLKKEAIEDLNNKHDQIVLMAGRLESHVVLQLMHFSKYQKDRVWVVGSSDSENVDFLELIKELMDD